MPNAPIVKSPGVTPTERLLAELCERSFLRLWSYPNPYKDDGKEFCDLLAVFEDHVFIFFDRESRHLKARRQGQETGLGTLETRGNRGPGQNGSRRRAVFAQRPQDTSSTPNKRRNFPSPSIATR